MAGTWTEMESALCRIPHVTSAHVVADAEGAVRELHVVSTTAKPPKQVVRDVQALASASFGLDLDRNVVSVVQLEDEPGDSSAPGAPAAAPSERTLLTGMTLQSQQGQSSVSVVLRWNGREVRGSASRPATAVGLHRLAAEATLDALRQLHVNARTSDVDSVEVRQLGSRQVALVSLAQRSAHVDEVLIGKASVRAAGEFDAVARAVLDALNRRLSE